LPESEDWLASSDGRTHTWVFGRKDEGYIALCSARHIKWVRDMRFADDPDPASPDTVGQGRFTSTELRADDGSNVWICVIGNRTQFGSFETFKAKIRSSYVDFSGVGRVAYEMPAAPGTGEPGFRWELFVNENAAHLNGVAQDLDNYPRFEGRYVAGRKPGRVEWREAAYKIVHPITGLWVSHDTSRSQREVGPLGLDTLLPQKTPSPQDRAAAIRLPIGEAAATKASPKLSGRARRFRLEPDD
jgi:hypothetical protein